MKLAAKLAMVMIGACGVCAAQQASSHAVGELYASDASVRGSMVMTASGTKVLTGSQVSAGEQPAVLRLSRGGEVRICPGTSVAVSQQAKASPILYGVNTGAMEVDYKLDSVQDSIVTPDFRLQLIGPGTFHLAIGQQSNGDMCVKSLAGQNVSVIVSEMMGDGTYQVAAGWSVVFLGGKIKEVYSSDKPCGCPAPPKQDSVQLAKAVDVPQPTQPAASQPSVVEVEAPMVFHGDATNAEAAADQRIIATLRMRPIVVSNALMPSKMEPPKKEGFFARIKRWFSR